MPSPERTLYTYLINSIIRLGYKKISNNTVHDHGAMGIICSLDCYDITIEGNEVYNSAGSGIKKDLY